MSKNPCIAPGCVLAAAQGGVYCEGHEVVRNDVFEEEPKKDVCWACDQHVIDCECAERAERDQEWDFFQGEDF